MQNKKTLVQGFDFGADLFRKGPHPDCFYSEASFMPMLCLAPMVKVVMHFFNRVKSPFIPAQHDGSFFIGS